MYEGIGICVRALGSWYSGGLRGGGNGRSSGGCGRVCDRGRGVGLGMSARPRVGSVGRVGGEAGDLLIALHFVW